MYEISAFYIVLNYKRIQKYFYKCASKLTTLTNKEKGVLRRSLFFVDEGSRTRTLAAYRTLKFAVDVEAAEKNADLARGKRRRSAAKAFFKRVGGVPPTKWGNVPSLAPITKERRSAPFAVK